MISFIIIGKNIQHTVSLCLKSVENFIKENGISGAEIIYVDSNSTDNTVNIAKQFSAKIILIKGQVNAAIGRNVGAKQSSGDFLFFIDGDMELIPDFYKIVFNKNNQIPDYPFINGFWQDKYYNSSFDYLYTEDVVLPDKVYFNNTTGGLMIVARWLWEKVEGMDERLIRSQDHDIGFRISKIGYPAKKYNLLFSIHHTVSYFDNKRSIQFFLGKSLLSTGLLMRKHLFNRSYLKRNRYSVFFVAYLFFSFCLLTNYWECGVAMIVSYLFVNLIRAIKNSENRLLIVNSFIFKSLSNLYTLIGFLFYYPSKKNFNTIKIN